MTDRCWAWAGRAILAIAVLHTLFGLFTFSPAWSEMAQSGVWNSVTTAERAAAVWFGLTGLFMVPAGIAIDGLERRGAASVLRTVGACLLAICILGIAMMPASGFWLVLIPAIGLLLKKGHTQ